MSSPLDPWRARTRTIAAMGYLAAAMIQVRLRPWQHWRHTLGFSRGRTDVAAARHRARIIERAAMRLPLASKCLEQAAALSWQLQRAGLSHAIVIATRPANQRAGDHGLHAWVEAGGTIILGALPGPWAELWRSPGCPEGTVRQCMDLA